MRNITTLGIDIAKNVFQLHGIDKQGKILLKKRISREKLSEFIANLPPCLIGMEACGGANYWHRKFIKMGHDVKLIAPQFVKPYVKSNKNDANDAQAIVEAVTRPHMRFVSPKEIEHQDIQSIHRVRSRLVEERTALINQIRGLLTEYGIVVRQGIGHVRRELPFILEDAENELTIMGRELFADLYHQLCEMDQKIHFYEDKIIQIAKASEACQRLMKMEGIGPITATTVIATIANPKVFKNGRQMAAALGLVPKQRSSGGKDTLLGISKRGDCYLRKLLIHGARSVVRRCDNKQDTKSTWLQAKKQRSGFNKTCVALANKNARTIWALLVKQENYRQAA